MLDFNQSPLTDGLPAGTPVAYRVELAAGDLFVAELGPAPAVSGDFVLSLKVGDEPATQIDAGGENEEETVTYFTPVPVTLQIEVAGKNTAEASSFTLGYARVPGTALISGQDVSDLEMTAASIGPFPRVGLSHISLTAGQLLIDFGLDTPGNLTESLYLPAFPGLHQVGNGFDATFDSSMGELSFLVAQARQSGTYLHVVQPADTPSASSSYGLTPVALTPVELDAPASGQPSVRTDQHLGASTYFAAYRFQGGLDGQTYQVEVSPVGSSLTQQPLVMVFTAGDRDCWVDGGSLQQYCTWAPDDAGDRLALVASGFAELPGETAVTAFSPGYQTNPGTVFVLVSDGDGEPLEGDAFDLTISLVPPPANDTCEQAAAIVFNIHELQQITGDLLAAQNDLDAAQGLTLPAGSCTYDATKTLGGYTSGPDVVYSIALTAGQTLTATLSADGDTLDPALYLLIACPANQGPMDPEPFPINCEAGADSFGMGQGAPFAETLTYPVTVGGTYLLVVDSFYGYGGFTLDVQVD